MVSPQLREQLQRVDDPAGMLVLVKLEHPAIETAYVVNDTRDWVIGGQTWVGLPFRFRLPRSVAGEPQRGQIEIDNVQGLLSEELEKLPPGGALMATFTVVSRARPEQAELSFAVPFSGVSGTTAMVTATLGNDDALRAPAVKRRYDPFNSPGLFAG
ncbi:MAG: DUF1833 domain-containing protein [Roseateles sp.]|nr:MAG: DUF1833 domain-containing protein [Roseateles sp.]